jgi:hypothetical protein
MGKKLGVAGGSVSTTSIGAIAATIVDQKGDLIAATAADTVARLAVGANNTLLAADSTQATGLAWVASPTIADSGLYYTGTTVETALAEIGAFRDRQFSNEVQTITLSSWDATDTVKFTFNTHETAAVTYASDVSAAIQTALIGLTDFDTGDLIVSRTDVNTYVVTFAGSFAGKDVGPITVTSGTGSATGTVAETTKGGQLLSTSFANAGAVLTTGGGVEGVVTGGNTGASQTISITNGNLVTYTVNAACTFTMPSGLTSGKVISFTVILTDSGGPRTITFTGVKWSGGTDPTVMSAASAIDIYSFVTIDGGTTWYGFTGGTGMAT